MKYGTDLRLKKSFQNAPVLPLYPHSRIVLMSDCHRGCGNSNDNFLKNQHLYAAALDYYYTNGFTYLELGDGDELWENRTPDAIREIHSSVCWMLGRFASQKRLWMVYGNHDYVLKNDKTFPHYPGLILKTCGVWPGGVQYPCLELYLTHGHQAELLNSTLWRVSRLLVRYIWKPLEQIGVRDPTSAAKNYKRRKKSELRLSRWARANGCILITGHTHRPMLGNRETMYFNTGSCVHPRCITCLELEQGAISLVKWCMEARPDRTLYVARTVLAGPLSLTALL